LLSIPAIALLSGCGGGYSESSVDNGVVNFAFAPVDGGSCDLFYFDADGATSSAFGPVDTIAGVATFQNVPPDLGLVLLSCSGGSYVDEATGDSMVPPVTRNFVNITSSNFTVTASPLTELATRIAFADQIEPAEIYEGILAGVATAFGMGDFDIGTTTPMNLNVEEADGSANGRYGVVLAALSQMQLDIGAADAGELLDTLQSGLAGNGLFTVGEILDLYFAALENTFDNPLIDPNLGFDVDLDALFDAVASAPLTAEVVYADAVGEGLDQEQENIVIFANEPSTIDIAGTHLHLGISVTLDEAACRVRDLESLADTNQDSNLGVLTAECPAVPAGTVELDVFDGDSPIGTAFDIIVTNRIASTKSQQPAISAATAPGSSFVGGFVTAEAPGITPPNAAHNYDSASLEVFSVAGVEMELIDSEGAVLSTTTTEQDGGYFFSNVPESTSVRVVVKAQVRATRSTPSVGPQYNFTVRDNTSTTTPKSLYQITSPAITTSATPGDDNFVDILARVGFNGNGAESTTVPRESAPFAILRVVNSAAQKLIANNPNISMPDLNLFWSTRNLAASGNKDIGQIGTSHYAARSTTPGVYILGRADSDTDEFDQGVLGHEFGHYLQDVLSFSDNPGGSHSFKEFKDASLAYGEGYGTAVGGLLGSGPNARFYCDTSGDRQSDGSCEDLTTPVATGRANGFYSEESVIYLMYQIGNIPGKGFGSFFDAVTQLRSGVHSATIFSFLNAYIAANPDVEPQVLDFMATANIKSTDPFGALPPNTESDPAISAAASRGSATVGATDLERLYLPVTLLSDIDAPDNADLPPAPLTSNEPTFCLNNNLRGADSSNGLGMTQRFQFTSNFTGNMLFRAVDTRNRQVNDQATFIEVRDSTGKPTSVYGYDGVDTENYYGLIEVVSGRTYSLVLNVYNPEIIQRGSQCGYKLMLARTPNDG
jgi:hypothetical protein